MNIVIKVILICLICLNMLVNMMMLGLKSGPQIAGKTGIPAGLLFRRIWYSVWKSGVLGITEYRQGRPLILNACIIAYVYECNQESSPFLLHDNHVHCLGQSPLQHLNVTISDCPTTCNTSHTQHTTPTYPPEKVEKTKQRMAHSWQCETCVVLKFAAV